jgi:hypothetical protein
VIQWSQPFLVAELQAGLMPDKPALNKEMEKNDY